MKTLILITMALFALETTPAAGQKPGVVIGDEPGWKKIGETEASFRSQDESIAVLGADEFSAIKIKVEDAPLHIERLQVFYESGEMEEIDVKKRIQAGDESDVFRLEHPDRDIQKVAFTYNTEENAAGDKAGIQLFGLKSGDEGKESSAYHYDAEKTKEDVERKIDETETDINREAEETETNIERRTERAEKDIDQRAERNERDLERAADRTGDAISETAAKAAAEIDDPRHDTKVGPNGQTIYVSDDSRFYYINDEGRRVYVSKAQLKDRS